MSNFSKAKKTYTKAEVESYIQKMMTSAEIALTNQRDLISSLKQTIENEKQELNKIKERESRSMNALSVATKRVNDCEKQIKDITNIKRKQFEQFSYKWKAFFEEKASEYKIKESEFKTKELLEEVSQIVDYSAQGDFAPKLVKKESTKNKSNKTELSAKELDMRYENILKRVSMLTSPQKKRGRPVKNAKTAVIELSEVMAMPKDSLNRILSELL
ncbi:MAG: hypothetical protein RR334_01775 [Clostridia bacterium]